MAQANPRVMEMIETAIRKDPGISNPELLEKAKAIDEGVTKLSPRQFNAMYPLQVKRAMKPARPTRRPGRAKTRSGAKGRDRVRSVLLDLARDVASAEGKGDVVDVVAGIDRYVDRVLKAAG